MQHTQTPPEERVKVFIFLLLGLTAFGFSPIIVRFSGSSDPVALAVWRTLTAALILLPFWFVQFKSWKKRKQEFTTDLYYKMLSGGALGLHFVLWIYSLHHTTVASASTLVTIHPIILIVVESLLFKMKFKGNVWLGVLIAFGGSLLLGWSDHTGELGQFQNPLFGNLMALLAACVFVVYFMISRKLRQTTGWLNYVFNVYLYAALSAFGIALLFGIDLMPTPLLLICALGLALGPQIIGHGSMNYAVKYVPPTILSTLILSEPLFATLLAYLFFGEEPFVLSLVAMTVILIGVSLTWKRKKKKPVPETS